MSYEQVRQSSDSEFNDFEPILAAKIFIDRLRLQYFTFIFSILNYK